MIVRREEPADHAAVRDIHRAAFGAHGRSKVVEARLTDELREDVGFLPHLSLVAEDDGLLLGHVIATRGWLEPFGTPVLGLGPLGVLPEAPGRRWCTHPSPSGQAVRTAAARGVPVRRSVRPAVTVSRGGAPGAG